MKMNEKMFQDMIILLFKQKDAHAVNMEPGITNPGIPDLNWCLEGIEGNLELKFGQEDGPAPNIKPTQIAWFRDRVKAGGYPMVAYYVESDTYADDVLVFQGRYLADLARCHKIDQIYDIPHLRVINPQEMIEALLSEIASWHDEMHPETSPTIN